MDQLIKLLQEKTGIDEATANKVADFIKEHAHELPQMLSGGNGGDIADKAKDMLGGFLGGSKND